MMEAERREEPKRMDIEKPIALFVPGKRKPYRGTTRNMSDAGICADFKKLPKKGDDVMLHVYWQADKPPIEQAATLVWRDTETGVGKVEVGLQLRDEPAGAKAVPADAPAPAPAAVEPTQKSEPQLVCSTPVIERGGEVKLLVGGVAVEAVAASVGDIREDNTVEVVLEITDPAFTGVAAASEDLPPEEQDWTPHPFRDTWRAAAKVVGPATRGTMRIAKMVFLALSRTAALLLQKIKSRSPKKLSA